MGKFFTSWKLWQEMTFVLACGIVATILFGLCKLRYDIVKMRKYTQVDKGKEAQTPEMLESQSVVPKGDEIPFGIRAIESGIEVDGVWISRSNTPAGSNAGSSASSISRVELPRSFNNSQLELPQAQALYSSSVASSRAASPFDVATNAERIRTNDSGDVTRNSAALHALEGQQYGSAASSSRRQPVESQYTSKNTSGKSSRRTSDESDDYMALPEGLPYPAAYIASRHTSHPPVVDPRTDLDLLQSHRMSHVAETGQLTPRVRKPGNNGEGSSAGDRRTLTEIVTTNGVEFFSPQQKTPSPPPPPAVAPTEDTPVPSASGSTQDSNAANQARQAVPLLETYASRPFYLPDVYQPRGPAHQFSYDEMPIEVQTQQNTARESEILRKVNPGFEILRPGTFAPSSPEEETETPVTQKRQSKRLQKKRTTSDGSRTSHFVEQV